MKIIRKARGKEIPKRAQRVFFSCDMRNVDGKERLVADLLSTDAGMDCVVILKRRVQVLMRRFYEMN